MLRRRVLQSCGRGPFRGVSAQLMAERWTGSWRLRGRLFDLGPLALVGAGSR